MIKLLKLEKFCFCTNLRTGANIIGLFEAVTGSIGLILGLAAAGGFDGIVQLFPESQQNWQRIIYGTSVAIALASGIQFLIALLLLAGNTKNKTILIVPWLVYSSVNATVITITTALNFVAYLLVDKITLAVLFASIAALYLCVKSYFILVIYSVYRNVLKIEKEKERSLQGIAYAKKHTCIKELDP